MSLVRLFLMVALLAAPAASEDGSSTLALGWNFSGQPLPRFTSGGIISHEITSGVVRLFEAGQVRSTYSLSLPDAAGQLIRDVTRASDGTAAVLAGDRTRSNGSVIIWLTRGGKLSRVVKTGPFVGMRASFRQDGSLWVIGRVPDERFENVPGHQVLRRYDRDGRLIGESLPVETFAAKNPMLDARLIPCGERTGIWMPASKEWVELSDSGTLSGRWQAPALPHAVGLACVADRLYLTVEDSGMPKLLELSKSGSALVARDATASLGDLAGVVVGSDGDQLVVYSKAPAKLTWIRP